MGLSRKLGGAQSSRAETPAYVDYQWSTQAYTMREILTRFQLPSVVQCSGDAGTVLWDHFRFDMRQPLLLHAARTVRKLHSRSLKMDPATGQMEEFGPPLAIPEDYDGWFFPVNKKDPDLLPRHTRIEGVASSDARKFLVTTNLPAFTPRKGPENGSKHVPHEVGMGEVLTKVGVIKGDPAGEGSVSPSALVQRSCQSLMCVDESQMEVIIPFNHCAPMFDVAEKYGRRPEPSAVGGAGGGSQIPPGPSVVGVVNTCAIVSAGNACLPRVFRHVLGELPALTEVFTGLLRCYSVFTEETVMAATMSKMNLASMSEVPSCLELATDSAARFNIALNAADLRKTNQYYAALRTCEEQAPSYVRAIKMSFTVQPAATDLEDVDLSLYETLKPAVTHLYMPLAPDSSSLDGASVDGALDSGKGDYVNIASLGRKKAEPIEERTDDGDESAATDDVDSASAVETTSVSDAQSCDIASMSDVVEVEANSEFDISWGQLRRARSFTGSISSENSETTSSSTIHSDTEDSEDSFNVMDDNSSISQDSVFNRDDNSSTSQDTVVLKQSRTPATQGHGCADGSADKDEDTVSEVSSFGEADVDTVFRVQASSSQRLGGHVDDDVTAEEDEQEIRWEDGISIPPLEGSGNLWSLHYDRNKSVPKNKHYQSSVSNANPRPEPVGACVKDSDAAASRQQSTANGDDNMAVKQPTINSTAYCKPNRETLTQPYREIPRRSRVQSHPRFSTHQQQQSGLSTFPTSHPRSASTSTSRANDLNKDARPKHSESDPNVIHEKEGQDAEEQIDLEFVRSLGEKLLAVSKRSSMPKYHRLETETSPVPTRAISSKEDHRSLPRRLRQSSSNPTLKSDSNSSLNSDNTAGVDVISAATEGNVKRGLSKREVLLDEFDWLEEEIV